MYSTIVTILSVHLFIYKVRMSSYVYYNTFYITIYIIISIGAESGIPAIGVFVHVLEDFGVFLFAWDLEVFLVVLYTFFLFYLPFALWPEAARFQDWGY